MAAELIELIQNLGQPRVLVLGDAMLDRYVWGDAARISQEAPVILLRADKKEERLGGATSVATMLRALGAKVTVAGVVGEDADAGRIRRILADLDIDHDGLIGDPTRPTTVKERYIGRAQHKHPQQMLRVDYEVRDSISQGLQHRLTQVISQQIKKTDVILISDYDKGVCTANVVASAIASAKSMGIKTLVDPARGSDYSKYRGCSTMTPNRLEASLATGKELNSREAIMEAAKQLRDRLELEASIITLDKDGMALFHRNNQSAIIPTRPRQVYDITGAGDMVLSVLGMALAAGADYEKAIRLANVAGGLEVEKIGVATVTRDEILRDILHGGSPQTTASSAMADKVHSLTTLTREISYRRNLGQRIAFTNGCFDILHAGHVDYLQMARAQADVLIVALNSDDSIRQLKGPDRPINPLEARLKVLTSLQAVDYVTVFEENTPLELIKTLRPDVLVKGADYRKEEVVGADFVEAHGGRVYLAPLRPGYSTTNLVEKLKAA